jgi:hypothetical protein
MAKFCADIYGGLGQPPCASDIAKPKTRAHNSMLEIALILREHLLSEIFVGQSKQVDHLNTVIAQLSVHPPTKL